MTRLIMCSFCVSFLVFCCLCWSSAVQVHGGCRRILFGARAYVCVLLCSHILVCSRILAYCHSCQPVKVMHPRLVALDSCRSTAVSWVTSPCIPISRKRGIGTSRSRAMCPSIIQTRPGPILVPHHRILSPVYRPVLVSGIFWQETN
ncbi:hypothetical protein F4778DRAFT_742222, partial [Xylariomycetidae sp. FL2044]